METSHSVLRYAKRFFAGTLLSRISGALRDMAMAFCFGSAPEIAAFMVAYRLANLFRRLFGEGTLQAGFIPHFEALPEQESFRFYRDTSFTMGILLLGIVVGMQLIFGVFSRYASAEWAQIAHLAMWMMPGLFFICLYALNSALLQTQRSFFLPAMAPVLFNLAWIGAAFFSYRAPIAEAVHWLSFGIVLSFALQWLMTSLQTRRYLPPFERPRLFSSEWKQLVRSLSLGVIGMGAVQINTVIDAFFARLADPSGPAFLWYALRIEQLPLALFGLALARAVLPPLARAMREGDMGHYRTLLQESLRHAAALMIPCTFALFALGFSGINLLFGRGHFTSSDVVQTVYCLWGYGIGLIPAVFVLLLANGFYAKKDYSVPMLASLAVVGINIVLNALFIGVFHWGALSVAIATSAATAVNAAILGIFLYRQIGLLFPPFFGRYVGQLALAGAFALGCTWLAEYFIDRGLPRGFQQQLQQFCVGAAIYGGAFLAAIRAMGLWESITVFVKTNATRTRRPEGR